MYRVLVTGSREWTDRDLLERVLGNVLSLCPLVIVHGKCPRGADKMASAWVAAARAQNFNVTEEPHPADWKRYHNGAGPIRNQEMADLGADVVYAFFAGDGTGSKGTADCARRAEKAGLQVRKFYG